MSFSDPILFRGILFSTFALYSSSHETPGGSSIAPGAIALTLILGANSLAIALVNDSSPPFAAVYTAKFATPLVKLLSVMLTIEPLELLK